MLKRRQKYVPQTDADAECRSSIGIPSRRVPLVAMDPIKIQASPPPTSIAQLSEYMQQVELTDSLLATDPVTPGSDTELDSIFDSDETYTDSSTPESPSCEPWISDFLDSENESADDKNRVHNLLPPPTPPFSTRKAANIKITRADVVEATNIQRRNFILPEDEAIPEGISSSQICASSLRQVFRTRDHRRGSKYMKEEVKVLYDTITRHRSLGCDDRFIADLVVLAGYSWRGDDKRTKNVDDILLIPG
ncbi:hypothetical protein V1523DRAFT_442356 [Lipomyces doorenjongii]